VAFSREMLHEEELVGAVFIDSVSCSFSLVSKLSFAEMSQFQILVQPVPG
jgi:hypothetical protein